MNADDALLLLIRTLGEGAAIAFVLCVLRSLAVMRLQMTGELGSTAMFAVVFPTVVPYGGKLLELLWQGPTGNLIAEGYSASWLLIAMQGRMAGAAIGVIAALLVFAHRVPQLSRH